MSQIKIIKRTKSLKLSRYPYLRLDKNERTSPFNETFLREFKKNLKSLHFTCYPEMYSFYQHLAKLHKLKIDHFLAISGIDHGLKSCIETFSTKNKNTIILNPTFAMIKIYLDVLKKKIKLIGYDNNFNLKYKQLLKSINKQADLIILSNPNSPTGTLIDKKNLIFLLKKAKKNKIKVVIDEAYFGFSSFPAISLLKKFDNLIILRTFSKSYGLAGLRAGYIISNPKNIELLSSLKPMYELNSLSLIAIRILLKKKYREDYIKKTNLGKKILINFLKRNEIPYRDTFANFILIDFKNFSKNIIQLSKKKKIIITGGFKSSIMKKYTRVTTAPPNEIKKFITVIKNVIQKKYQI